MSAGYGLRTILIYKVQLLMSSKIFTDEGFSFLFLFSIDKNQMSQFVAFCFKVLFIHFMRIDF